MDVAVEEIMVKDVVCVNTAVSLQELVEIFFSKKVSGVPVVDDNSKLVGIISKTDLVTHGLEKELNTIIGSKTGESSPRSTTSWVMFTATAVASRPSELTSTRILATRSSMRRDS